MIYKLLGIDKISVFKLECKIGTTTEAGGRCSSCQNDLYGEKCGQKCNCDETER